jgi:Zn-dependent protease with chaperone function
MYAWLGVALALGAFAAANLAGSLLAFGAWQVFRPVFARARARRRADWLFGLRVFPATLALCVAAGLVAPAYLLYEPADAGESPGGVLLALALAGAWLVATGVGRVAGASRATRRFLQERLPGARALALADAPGRPYGVRHGFPTVSLVGLARPRVLLAEPVLAALDAGELSVVLAHEAGHASARDNLRALVLRAAPCAEALGRRLEHQWREASEQAADDYAVAGRADRALSLAAALVKVARLAPEHASFDLASIAFHSGDGVAGRVRRLLDVARHDPAPHAASRPGVRRFWLLAPAAWASLALPGILPRVHQAIELFVRHLP